MAFSAFAVLLSQDATVARYDCGYTEDGPERGVLRVVYDGEFRYEWEDGRPADVLAEKIAGKAAHLFLRDKRWPMNASIQV